MIRAMLGKNRLPVRFFLPLGIVLIVLAIAIGGVYGYQNATLMIDNTEEVLVTSLAVSVGVFDRLITELDAMAYDILSSRALQPYAKLHSATATLATEWLTSFGNANSYLKDIVLLTGDNASFNEAEPQYATTFGVWTKSTFWRFLHPITYEGVPLRELLPNLKRPALLFPVTERVKSGKNGYLVYAYPGPGTPETRGIVLFLVDASLLEKNLGQAASAYGGALQVYASDGRMLYDAGAPWQSLSRAEIVSLVVGETLSFPEESCLAQHSPLHGYTYVLRIPSSAYPSRMASMLLPLLPVLAVFVALGLSVAYMIIRALLRPISQISDILAPYNQPEGEGRPLGNIVLSIRALQSQKDQLESFVQRQTELSQMQCVHNLLHGVYKSEKEIRGQFADVSIQCDAAYYVVLAVSADMDITRQDASMDFGTSVLQILSHVEQIPGEVRFSVPLDEVGMTALLIGVTDAIDLEAHLSALFSAVDAMLHAAFGASLTMGAGSPVKTLIEVPESFRQARAALGNRFFAGARSFLLFDSAMRENSYRQGWYPAIEEEALIATLPLGDYGRIAQLVGNLSESLRAKTPPVHIAKTICASVTHRLIRYADESARAGEAVAAFAAALRLLELAGATLDAFEDALLTGCASLCGAMERKGNTMRSELLCRRVMDFGKEHFADQALSLSSIAEAFSLSEGHLARTFKEQTGTTVMQWLDTVRLTHAQSLLRETSLPLDEIIARCGYLDKSNFIRKFKKACQLTPMQYREAAQALSDAN